MQSSSKVSVIMPSYNSTKFIRESIISVLNQSYQNFELIIIDDCSSDESLSIINEFSDERIVKIFLKENKGHPSIVRNIGIKHADGELLSFLDSDDLWEPTKLEKQVLMFEKDRSLGLVYTGGSWISEKGEFLRKIVPRCSTGNILNEQLKRYEINNQGVMIKKDLAYECGLFDETILIGEDFNLYIKILSKCRGGVIQDSLYRYRKHSQSISSLHRFETFGLEKTHDYLSNTLKAKDLGWLSARIALIKARELYSQGRRWEAYRYLVSAALNKPFYGLFLIMGLIPALWFRLLQDRRR